MSAPLSDTQENAIRTVPRVMAGLSLMGSAFILVSGLRRRRQRKRPIIGASLVAGMSLADVLSSIAYLIGDAAFPASMGGQGNQATCNGA